MSTVEYDTKLDPSQYPDIFQHVVIGGLSGTQLNNNPVLFIAGDSDEEVIIDSAYIRWQGDIGSSGNDTTWYLWRAEAGEQHTSASGGEQVGSFAIDNASEDTNVPASLPSGSPVLKAGDALVLQGANLSVGTATVHLRVRTRRIA